MPRPFMRPQSDQENASPGQHHPRGIITSPAPVLPPGTPPHILERLAEHLQGSREQTDLMAKLLRRRMDGPRVLETATVTIPAQAQEAGFEPGAPGVFTQDRYKVPYASVIVLNYSTSPLVVSSGAALGASAPGGGQGQFIVPAFSYVAINMEGSSLTIYGAAGSVLSYSVMSDRIYPSAGPLTPNPAPMAPNGLSAQTGNKVTPTTAQQAIATIPVGASFGLGPYQATVATYVDGTTTVADEDNMELSYNGGSQVINMLCPIIVGTGVNPLPFTNGPYIIGGINGINSLIVRTKAIPSGTAVYHALVTIIPVGASI